MGLGIAHECALKAGLTTIVVDTSPVQLKKAEKFIKSLLDKAAKRSQLSAVDASAAFERLKFTTDLENGVKDVEYVIEAVPENLDLKRKIFQQLEQLAPKTAVLGSNTSSISITTIAASIPSAQDRVVGIHFFNPVPKMKGVEVIRGLRTSDEVCNKAVELAKKLDKKPSLVTDSPGFLANRMLAPYISEAISLYENGVASAEDIDNIMVSACAMPIGPLRLADFLGLDTMLFVSNVLRESTADPKYRKSVLLQKMVDAGYLGVKSGRGFYKYGNKL